MESCCLDGRLRLFLRCCEKHWSVSKFANNCKTHSEMSTLGPAGYRPLRCTYARWGKANHRRRVEMTPARTFKRGAGHQNYNQTLAGAAERTRRVFTKNAANKGLLDSRQTFFVLLFCTR